LPLLRGRVDEAYLAADGSRTVRALDTSPGVDAAQHIGALQRAPPPTQMSDPITVLASMAPKAMLADLAESYELCSGARVAIEAAGGVHVKQQVQAGAACDVVVLASDAIEQLARFGHVLRGSTLDIACSAVAVAVRTGALRPEIGSEAALERAVLAASTIGCSTGPSGVGLMALFERWGIAEKVRARIVTPRPGVPVGALVASGDVALGFQQLSELMDVDGIDVLGLLPPGAEVVTTFSAGVAAASNRPDRARELVAFLASPSTADVKLRRGMAPVVGRAEGARTLPA